MFLLLTGNFPCVLLSVTSLCPCYTAYSTSFQLCSLDSSPNFHQEKHLDQFHMTWGAGTALTVWVSGWVGPHLHAVPWGRKWPSSSFLLCPGLVPSQWLGTFIAASKAGWSCYTSPCFQRALPELQTEWLMAPWANPKDWGDKYTSFMGKQTPGHILCRKNEMASELFCWIFITFILYCRTLFSFYIHICLYLYISF